MAANGRIYQHLREFAPGFPETCEDHPWGETAFKVWGKAFVFLGGAEGELRLSLKLPQSKEFALESPFTEPAGYGLGKSGWVTAAFNSDAKAPLDVPEAWIAESYRAVAPRSLAGSSKTPTRSTEGPNKKSVTLAMAGVRSVHPAVSFLACLSC